MSVEPRSQSPRTGRRVIAAVAATLAIGAVWLLMWRGADVRRTRLAALLKAGQSAQALDLANQLLQTTAEDDDLLRAKCQALEELRRVHEAVGTYSLIQSPTVTDFQNWASALMRLNQWQAAAEVLTKAQQQTSTDAAVTWQLTACWLQLKRPASAIDSAQQLLLVPGYRGRAHLQLAAAYRQLDDLQNVSRHLELALSEKGEPLPLSEREIRLSAAEALLIAGRARRALKVLQEGPATDTDMQLLLLRGDANLQLGDYAAAEREYRQALALDSRHAGALESLAEIKLQQKLPAAAVELLLPLAESPGTTSATAFLLQRAYTDLRNFPEAHRWQRQVEELRQAEQASTDRQ